MDIQKQETLTQLVADVKRILFLIDNDDATGRKGLFKTVEDIKERVYKVEEFKAKVDKIDDLEARLKKLEDDKKVQKGKNIVLGALGAFVLMILKEILPFIFH